MWDDDSAVLTIRMTTDAALEAARKTISLSGTSLTTAYELVEYSRVELDALADRLLSNQVEWAGASGIGGGHYIPENRVILEVDPDYKDAAKLIAAIEGLGDPRIELELIEPVEGWVPESRMADFQPYTAGAAIDSSTGLCTLGWTWRRWSSNQVVGSTARHCANLVWSNNGTYVGTVFQSNQSTDSALMSGTTYSPTVFVGGTPSNPNTTVVRRVTQIDTSWDYDDDVAMSGRTTGLNVAEVKYATYTLTSCAGAYAGLTGVLMQTHVTAGGDSGGPWLTTQTGTGYVTAHGQHFGHGCVSGNEGSFFIKLNAISAAQSVSILFY